nr:MAG TPA: helix-turn-helix domain protein [Caudoviricetes sp.]
MKKLLYKLYVEENKTLQEVADAIGVSRPTTKKYLIENGIKLRSKRIHKKVYPEITIEKIMNMYESGKLVNDIAKEFGVSRSTITSRLKVNGINLKNNKNQTRLQSKRMYTNNPTKGVKRDPSVIAKMVSTRKEKYEKRIREFAPISFEKYAKKVRYISYAKLKDSIPDGMEIDHLYSIKSGYQNNVPIKIISDIRNTQFLTPEQNREKGSSNSITLEELYKRVGVQRLA